MRDSAALAWRLDGVLRGSLKQDVLESYGAERSGNVQGWIHFAVELGKVICVPDPEAAAERDRQMLAARADPSAPAPARPDPRLGPGLHLDEAPGGGLLSPQGEIKVDGRRGLFDDVLGARFALIARTPAILDGLSDASRAALRSLDAAVVHFDDSAGGVTDVEGIYGRFLDTPAVEFRRVTDVTYLGTVNGTRVALRRMLPRDSGRIVNVCSGVAFRGMPLLSSYSGAKHAVRGFSQSVRAELAQDGSRVRLSTNLSTCREHAILRSCSIPYGATGSADGASVSARDYRRGDPHCGCNGRPRDAGELHNRAFLALHAACSRVGGSCNPQAWLCCPAQRRGDACQTARHNSFCRIRLRLAGARSV
jgi:NAD(P)-dependent dehydrogenase (short-subunit alcohol dehydrogenase family)